MNEVNVTVSIGINEIEALYVIQSDRRSPFLEVLGLVHSQPLLNLFHLVDAGVTNGIHAVLGPQGRAMH